MSIETITLTAYSILYNSGHVETKVFTNQQLAGFKRRKDYKKEVLSMKKLLLIETHFKIY